MHAVLAQRALSLFKVPGDYNQNGLVDAADYVVWRDTVGQMGAGLAADGNGDRQIDAADFNVWRTHFGATVVAATASTLAPVPEPATALIYQLFFLPASSSEYDEVFRGAK